MKTKQDGPVPNRYTGKWQGTYYYKGKRWLGPSNLVGYGRKGFTWLPVEGTSHQWGIR